MTRRKTWTDTNPPLFGTDFDPPAGKPRQLDMLSPELFDAPEATPAEVAEVIELTREESDAPLPATDGERCPHCNHKRRPREGSHCTSCHAHEWNPDAFDRRMSDAELERVDEEQQAEGIAVEFTGGELRLLAKHLAWYVENFEDNADELAELGERFRLAAHDHLVDLADEVQD